MESRCLIDWFRVIYDLNKNGYSTRAIAKKINLPYPTTNGWKHGAEPKHSDGEKLIKLWIEVTGQCRENLPPVTLTSHHFKQTWSKNNA